MADIDLSGYEGPLWATAIAFYGIGDLVTTWIGFQEAGVVETNPVASAVVEQFGFSGLILWKTAVLTAFILMQVVAPDDYEVGVPLGLSVVGVWVVWNNLHVIQAVQGPVGGAARSALPVEVESAVGAET